MFERRRREREGWHEVEVEGGNGNEGMREWRAATMNGGKQARAYSMAILRTMSALRG